MDKVLTIVVPSYNVEKYLKDTLESFISEKILDDIEVLIVNDGSKDSTAQIAENFEKRYPQSFKLINKENGGHGSTINRGIEIATGKYFKVVDGDDWVNTEDFIKMVEKLKETESDIVLTDYFTVMDGTREQKRITFPLLSQKKNWMFDELKIGFFLPMHAMCIKTKIFQENNIRLDENCFYVDNEYTAFIIPYVNSIAYFKNISVYMYRLALVTQSVSIKGYQNHINDHIKVSLRIIEFAEKYRKNNSNQKKADYLDYLAANLIGSQVTIFTSYPVSKRGVKEQLISFDDKVKKRSERIYKLGETKSQIIKIFHDNQFRYYIPLVLLSKVKRKIGRKWYKN